MLPTTQCITRHSEARLGFMSPPTGLSRCSHCHCHSLLLSPAARGGAATRLPTSMAAPMETEDVGVEAGVPKQAQAGRSRPAGASASSARSTGRVAAQSAAPGAAAQEADSDGGGAALPAAPGAADPSGGGQQAAGAASAEAASHALLMAILKGSYEDSDISGAEDTPSAAQGTPPVPAPVAVVPDLAPLAAPDPALADAGPAAVSADAQPAVAPAHLARPRVTSSNRPVNLMQKYGRRQR